MFKLVFYYSNPPKYWEKGKENGTERIFNYHRNGAKVINILRPYLTAAAK